jgi:hypothetical protein
MIIICIIAAQMMESPMTNQVITLHTVTCKGHLNRQSSISTHIELSMPVEVVERLLREQHLCVSEVKCLNSDAKQQLWRLCLNACKHCCTLTTEH